MTWSPTSLSIIDASCRRCRWARIVMRCVPTPTSRSPGLRDVTLVGNDTGGALAQLVVGEGTTRLSQIVLVSCDAFDNFPPGLTGKTVVLLGRLPAPLFGLFFQQMRLRPVRRLPIAFGWLTKRGDAVTARWVRP